MDAHALIADRYRVEERIARGGQASVFLARQEPLGRKVALKVLSPAPGADDAELRAFQERFLQEARTLAALDHPNIVVVHDYGDVEEGSFYIAMEYIEGKRFSDILREGPLAPERTLRLVGQVCGALRYAHRRGVVHRDIKNSNILVRTDHHGREQVKVVDFGIAKLMEGDGTLTMTGVVMGSPHFMAPEQARGAHVDHRVDIYAVGVLLYCGLVGRFPFQGTSSREILVAHLSQEVPTFATVKPDLQLDPAIERTVRRCLAKEPEDRFPDVDTLLTALQPFLDEDSSAPTSPTEMARRAAAASPPGAPGWVKWAVAAGALALLLPSIVLAVLAGWLLLRPEPAPLAVAPVPVEPAVVVEPEVLAAPAASEAPAPAAAVTPAPKADPPRSATPARAKEPAPVEAAPVATEPPPAAEPPPAQKRPAGGSDLRDPWADP